MSEKKNDINLQFFQRVTSGLKVTFESAIDKCGFRGRPLMIWGGGERRKSRKKILEAFLHEKKPSIPQEKIFFKRHSRGKNKSIFDFFSAPRLLMVDPLLWLHWCQSKNPSGCPKIPQGDASVMRMRCHCAITPLLSKRGSQ